MPTAYLIRFTRDAAGDLREIFDYIEMNSGEMAGRMIARIVRAIDSLNLLP